MFTESSEFKVPVGVEYLRALVVGGGGGGRSWVSGSGGSGYVKASTIKVIPETTYQVTVGTGGAGAAGGAKNYGVKGLDSSFSPITAEGGFPEGNGGSGSGGYSYDCSSATDEGGSGGSDGKLCNGNGSPGGKGQGSYLHLISIFNKSSVTAGAGGKCGICLNSNGGKYITGGGGGGVLINGNGPNGGNGKLSSATAQGAKGGVGYGAGGGAGGWSGTGGSEGTAQAGGAGASGVVYLEWD